MEIVENLLYPKVCFVFPLINWSFRGNKLQALLSERVSLFRHPTTRLSLIQILKKKWWRCKNIYTYFGWKITLSSCVIAFHLYVVVSMEIAAVIFSGHYLQAFDNTGIQRNWGKHKNTRFYVIWGCWIQILNPFLLITSSFLDMHRVHFVHIRYIKAYMNSGLILILWDLWLIF